MGSSLCLRGRRGQGPGAAPSRRPACPIAHTCGTSAPLAAPLRYDSEVTPWERFADLVLQREAALCRVVSGVPPRDFAGMYVDDDDLDTILRSLPGLDGPGPEAVAPVRDLFAPLVVEARAALTLWCAQSDDALARTCRNAALTSPDVESLALLTAVELNPQRQRVVAYVQDSVQLPRPTLALLARVLGPDGPPTVAPGAPMRVAELVTVEDSGPWAVRMCGVVPRLVWAVLGVDAPDADLPARTRRVAAQSHGRGHRPDPPDLLLVHGADAESRRRAAGAELAGRPVLATTVPQSPTEWAAVVREATVAGCAVLLEVAGPPEPLAAARIEAAPHLTFALSSPRELPLEALPDRRWREVHVLDGEAGPEDWLARTGSTDSGGARLTREQLRLVAGGDGGNPAAVQANLRRLAGGHLDGLAVRVRAQRGWDDLVLPDAQKSQLRELVARYRRRRTVYGEWGFPAIPSSGVVALFAGPSGTGKTLAAEVVAGELGLDLYKVDLSAVVSKYIGETEKNLERIFAAAGAGDVVLFFDEADALFGKRSEVRGPRPLRQHRGRLPAAAAGDLRRPRDPGHQPAAQHRRRVPAPDRRRGRLPRTRRGAAPPHLAARVPRRGTRRGPRPRLPRPAVQGDRRRHPQRRARRRLLRRGRGRTHHDGTARARDEARVRQARPAAHRERVRTVLRRRALGTLMTATLTRDALVKEPAAAERGRGRPAAAARGGVPTSNAGMARLARDGGAARANLVGTGGNRVARSTLAVSHPHDPAEREAEALASRVAHGASPPVALARTLEPAVARTLVSRDDAPAPAADVAAGGDVEVSTAVSSLIASPGAGAPMDPAVQAKVEPHLGADLGAVRVHQGPEVAAAAAELHARAFTVGADIFLGEGESSADLELMAHEATHVVQQQAVAVYRDLEVTDLLPDFIIDGVTSAAREIPGYTLLTVITGKDPLTDEPATVSRTEFVEKLLTYGPFGAAVGPLLQTIDVLGDIFTLLMDALAAHNLTLARIGHDIAAAWDEMSVTEGDRRERRHRRALRRRDRRRRQGVRRRRHRRRHRDGPRGRRGRRRAAAAAPRDRAVLEPRQEGPALRPAARRGRQRADRRDPRRLPAGSSAASRCSRRWTSAARCRRPPTGSTRSWPCSPTCSAAPARCSPTRGRPSSPENLPNLLDNLTSLADRAFGLLQDVGAFAATILLKVLELVKKALLGWLSEHAHRVPGFHLLTVILGRNPFTGEAVPRTAENLIKGFITLLPGGEAMYDQLAESGVIGDAAATHRGGDGAAGHLLGPGHRHVPRHLGHALARDLLSPDRGVRPDRRRVRRAAGPDRRVRRRRDPGGRHG